jgi:hypothetical protein
MKKKPTASTEAGAGLAVQTSGQYASADRALLPGEAQRLSGAVLSPADLPALAGAVVRPIPPRDQYTGLGGQYVRDPITGVRRPAGESEVGPADPSL